MTAMHRWRSGLVGAWLLLGAAAAGADARAPGPAPGSGDEAQLERRLEAAQRRLERAAQEVAELSAGLVPDTLRPIEIHVGEPRAMLGVQLGEARAGGGVRVAGVSPGGPAAEAGVKPGDVIVAVNGQRAAAAADVSREVQALKPGAQATLDLERGGKIERLVVVPRPLDPRLMLLGGDLLDGRLLESLGGMADAWHWGGGGWGELELAALSPDLGRYFGTDRGVLVIRAPADGSLRLRDGDVITAIDGREPHGVSHALRILRSYQPGEQVTLAILRDRKAQSLQLSMPARPAREGHAPPRPPGAPAAPAAPPAPPRGGDG